MTNESPVAELTAQTAILKDLVAYQQGAVISRNLLKEKTGFATLFAFDQGEGLSEHSAPFDALVYLIEGKAEITISGKPLQVSAGQTVVMPADEPHALQALERFKMLLVGIKP